MNNQKKSSSGGALIIIGLVFVVAVVLGIWFYNSSKSGTGNRNTTSNSAATKSNAATPNSSLATGPQGAVPPNMLGSPTALVTVEEFADYQCPTCAVMHPLTKELTSTYGSRIKFVFRNFPLTQIHDKAYDAAVAAEAAALQGKFWDMQNQLFTNQKTWVASTNHRALFDEYAQKIGLDLKRFQDDMGGMSAKTRVDADIARARAANLSGTPSMFINGMSVPFEQMNINALRQIIDAELAKQGSAQSSAPANPAAPAGSPAPAKTSAPSNSSAPAQPVNKK